MHYNRALIGVEANFSSYPIRELERLNYPKSICALNGRYVYA